MKKKSVVKLLTFVTAITLTACSFQFKGGNNLEIIPEKEIERVSNYLDHLDLNSRDDVAGIQEKITSWANHQAEENNLGEFQKARLIRVVDGDTIVVDINQEEYTVRMIGIDTPESVASEEYLNRTGKENTEEGKDASEFTRLLLEEYPNLYLQMDTSDVDRYGRLLRYVWIDLPEDQYDAEEIRTKMINAMLLDAGVATAVVYEPDTMHAEDFAEIEEGGYAEKD